MQCTQKTLFRGEVTFLIKFTSFSVFLTKNIETFRGSNAFSSLLPIDITKGVKHLLRSFEMQIFDIALLAVRKQAVQVKTRSNSALENILGRDFFTGCFLC